jgi:hypothetical protein
LVEVHRSLLQETTANIYEKRRSGAAGNGMPRDSVTGREKRPSQRRSVWVGSH